RQPGGRGPRRRPRLGESLEALPERDPREACVGRQGWAVDPVTPAFRRELRELRPVDLEDGVQWAEERRIVVGVHETSLWMLGRPAPPFYGLRGLQPTVRVASSRSPTIFRSALTFLHPRRSMGQRARRTTMMDPQL